MPSPTFLGTDSPLAAAEHVVVAFGGVATLAGILRRRRQAKKDEAFEAEKRRLSDLADARADAEKKLLQKQLDEAETHKIESLEEGQRKQLEATERGVEAIKEIARDNKLQREELKKHTDSDDARFDGIDSKLAAIDERFDSQDIVLSNQSGDLAAIKKVLTGFGKEPRLRRS